MTYVLTTWLLKIYIVIFLKQISILRSQVLVIWTVIIAFSIVSTYYLFLMASNAIQYPSSGSDMV